jgi:predicted nucleic acid-binding protein
MKGVFDTNILVDLLNGEAQAGVTLDRYSEKVISRISWMEVLVGVKNPSSETRLRSLLTEFRIAEVTAPVSETAVQIRRTTPKLKLPDAIIYATAREESCNLITRNTKDFPTSAADVTVPYTI